MVDIIMIDAGEGKGGKDRVNVMAIYIPLRNLQKGGIKLWNGLDVWNRLDMWIDVELKPCCQCCWC